MSTANLYRPVSKLFNGFDNQGCLASCYETLQNNIYKPVSKLLYEFDTRLLCLILCSICKGIQKLRPHESIQ